METRQPSVGRFKGFLSDHLFKNRTLPKTFVTNVLKVSLKLSDGEFQPP